MLLPLVFNLISMTRTCHLGKDNKDKAVIHPALICAKEKNKARWGNIDMWSGCYFNAMVSYCTGYKAIFFPIFYFIHWFNKCVSDICVSNTILNHINKHNNKKMLFWPLKDLWITDDVYKCLCARHTHTHTIIYIHTSTITITMCTLKIRLLCQRLLIALRHEEDILKVSHSNRTTKGPQLVLLIVFLIWGFTSWVVYGSQSDNCKET